MKKNYLFLVFLLFSSSLYSMQLKPQESKDTSYVSQKIGAFFLSTTNLRCICKDQITMMTKQGYQTEGLQKKLDSLPNSYDALLGFAFELTKTPLRQDFKYSEPFDLPAIQAARPKGNKVVLENYRSETEIKNKIYGGVFGQICGLTLGQPLEMSLDLPTIKNYLEGIGAWPLNDYVPAYSPTQTGPLRRDCIESMKGFVHLAKEDDDLNYLVASSKILESYGSSFKTENVARFWYGNLVQGWTWGPENTRLMLLGGIFCGNGYCGNGGKYPEDSEAETFVNFLNNGQELIGAMIRGEAYGFSCPGNPGLAAELAWRDGRFTHAKTGLYAEMWLSATIAAAFNTNDPIVAIKAGLEQIPENSRYAECIREALKISIEEKDWFAAYKRINEQWGYLGHAGTLNETAAMINGLVHSVDKYGLVDYEKAITITVVHGWDADCSCAMAGAIAGVLAGYNNIPEKWTNPLNDTYFSCVATERESKISLLAERFFKISQKNRK